jgi:hypothetical protein
MCIIILCHAASLKIYLTPEALPGIPACDRSKALQVLAQLPPHAASILIKAADSHVLAWFEAPNSAVHQHALLALFPEVQHPSQPRLQMNADTMQFPPSSAALKAIFASANAFTALLERGSRSLSTATEHATMMTP